MSSTTTKANTVYLHRVLRAPAEHVYRAFIDPHAMCKWNPPHGFVGEVHHMDARVGGTYRMSFINFRTGQKHSFGGTFVELSPYQRIRYLDKFEDPNMSGEMSITIELQTVACGTAVHITQENLPPQIPVEFCYLGWQESLLLLSQLVEADIPNEPTPSDNA